MPLIPYTRKAGDGGACAVLIGGGDGSLMRDCCAVYERVVVICMPGEKPHDPRPKNVDQYVVRGAKDAAEVVSHGFSHQRRVIDLECTDFYSSHPCVCDEVVRNEFAQAFYSLLTSRPFSMGDDAIDGLQGAYHIALSAHLIAHNPTPAELTKLSCPAICVAPGPSLAKHLDAIRALQDKCLIIAADTAMHGLIKAGITPHMVTPLERTDGLAEQAFPDARYPDVIYAGAPFANQDIAAKFDKHLFVPGSDIAFLWMGVPGSHTFFHGQSTGVMSASLASQLTTGPIYLVGHDLAFNDTISHWSEVHHDVQVGGKTERIRIPGNSGNVVESQMWWTIFLGELSDIAKETGRVCNVNGVTGDGAQIPGTVSMGLPDPASLEPFTMPQWPESNMDRSRELAAKIKRLPRDARTAIARLCSTRLTIEDLDFDYLCDSDNKKILNYICRSIVGQFAMQYRNGCNVEQTTSDCADALRNVLRQMMPTFEHMAQAPICQPAKHADTAVYRLQGASA